MFTIKLPQLYNSTTTLVTFELIYKKTLTNAKMLFLHHESPKPRKCCDENRLTVS